MKRQRIVTPTLILIAAILSALLGAGTCVLAGLHIAGQARHVRAGLSESIQIDVLQAMIFAAAAAWLFRYRRRLKRRERGLCPDCGCDLRGATGRCPQCGARGG